MAYFDDANNTTFYPSFSDFHQFDAYPTLGQTSATEEEGVTTLDTFAHGWDVSGQPGHMVGFPQSLRPEASFESVTPVTSYAPPVQDYEQLSFPEYYRPMTGIYAQSHYSGVVSRDNSFTDTVASDFSTTVPTLSSVPLNCWGDNESDPSASTSYGNVQPSYRPRTEQIPAWQFQPYGADDGEHRNAEAGPSTLVPSYVAPPTTHPSGGMSEAAADAANNQTITEEDTAPTTRRARGTGRRRAWRDRYKEDVHRLCLWAKNREGLVKLPSHKKALGSALELIETTRVPVYGTPRLKGGSGKRTAEGGRTDAEHRRRKGTRELNEELSRYYLLRVKKAVWSCPELLLEVLAEVEKTPGRRTQSP